MMKRGAKYKFFRLFCFYLREMNLAKGVQNVECEYMWNVLEGLIKNDTLKLIAFCRTREKHVLPSRNQRAENFH